MLDVSIELAFEGLDRRVNDHFGDIEFVEVHDEIFHRADKAEYDRLVRRVTYKPLR